MIVLCGTSASVAAIHTLLGPDHYVPFVAMARVGRWSTRKALLVTLGCGLGHVLSSVVLGLVGVALGISLFSLTSLELVRGHVAGWLMLSFGMVYGVWGWRRAQRGRTHSHVHVHAAGTVHDHAHDHHGEHLHVHAETIGRRRSDPTHGSASVTEAGTTRSESMTPWVLFVVFLFGPCEPLIPLLMYPAAQHRWWDAALVATIFGLTTMLTMLVIVFAGLRAASVARPGGPQRYAQAASGLVVAACGAAMVLGL